MPKNKRGKAKDDAKLATTALTEIMLRAPDAILEWHSIRKDMPSCSVSSEWNVKIWSASVKMIVE